MSTLATVYRTSAVDRFLIITNDTARGHGHIGALKALPRCVLFYLLSLPQGWRVTRAELDSAFVEGRDAVTRALRDLETHQYLARERHRGPGGTWVWEWRVTDDPERHPLKTSAWTEQGERESSQVAPSTEKPATVNQGIYEDGLPEDGSSEDGSTSSGGARATARASAQARQLAKLTPEALTQKLTSVWIAVCRENGGHEPLQDTEGWGVEDTHVYTRGKHPIGGQIKAWVESNPRPTAQELDTYLTRIRADAQRYAEKAA